MKMTLTTSGLEEIVVLPLHPFIFSM